MIFIRPPSDWTYYGMAMSVRVSVRPSVSHSFPHFSPTLSWNFVCHFFLMNIRSNSSAANFRQFLLELCPFWILEYWKYIVFRIFLLHALTYWAEMLHITLLYCITDQVRVSSICINFCRSFVPFGTKNTENSQFSALFSYMLWNIDLKFCIWLCLTVLQIKFQCLQFAPIFVELCPFWTLEYWPWKYTVFRFFLLHALTYWAVILHMTLFSVLQFKFECRQFAPIFVGVMPLF